MSTERDATRIVRSWLRTDEHESADRVLDNVFALLDATPQRRAWWPARRIADVNLYAKVAIAAAAVVVLAVVGFNLMPAGGGVGGPTPAPSPTASPSPSPSPSSTAAAAAAFPPVGPLAAGTHRAVLEGVPLTFSVPDQGWEAFPGQFIGTVEPEQPDSLAFAFWKSSPENVYSDPCAHTALDPPPAATAEGLAAAAAAIPGTDLVSGPSSVTVGGYPAQHVAFTIRDDLGCDPHDAYLWYDVSSGGARGGWHWASALGSTHQVWIIDVDGTLVWIDSETFRGAPPDVEEAVGQVIDSIQFE